MTDLHDEHEYVAYDDERRHRRERPHLVPELLRRAIENTVESVQSSGTLSREAFSYLWQQGDKGRREVVKVVAKEIGDFLRHTDVSSEVVKILTNVQMEMTIGVKFKRNPDGSGVTTDVSVSEPAPPTAGDAPHEGTPHAPVEEP